MGKIIGIDFGTTNSRVAVLEGGKPIVIANEEGSINTPSVVAFSGENMRLIGQAAKRQTLTNPERTAASIKRDLGVNRTVRVNGVQYYPEHISSMILRRLKEIAENYLGETVYDAVITVPSCYNDKQRRAVIAAGRIAGLNPIRIIADTSASAIAYAPEEQEERVMLVYSLGGGTFDASIVEAGDGIFEVLSISGNSHLGGDDFDQRIAEYLADQFRKENGIDLTRDRIAIKRLKEVAENARIELNEVNTAYISVPYITADASGPKHLNTNLTRTKFNELTRDLVDTTIECVRRALDDAHISADQVDTIIMTGGCVRIPAIQNAVRQLTGKNPVGDFNPDESAAIGAAIYAGLLNGEIQNLILLDATPMSFGIETEGHVFTKLIDRNTTYPHIKSQEFSTAADGQTTVEMHILQGENKEAGKNITVGKYRLTGIAPAQRGVPQIEVDFGIDRNGILSVSAKDKANNREWQVITDSGINMSEDEINQCLRAEEDYADRDRKRREAIETMKYADDLIFESEKTLRSIGDKLSAEDRETLRAEIAAFRKVREGNNADEIRNAMEVCTQRIYSVLARGYFQPEDTARKPNVVLTEDQREVAAMMLPILDDLVRAVQAAEQSSDKQLKKGVELIQKKMEKIYEQLGITEIDCLGKEFDPELEESVDSDIEKYGKPGTVCQVVQKGYMIGDEVFRHAKVVVVPK